MTGSGASGRGPVGGDGGPGQVGGMPGGGGMGTVMRAGVGLVLGARARLRWVHLVLGGALLMPYFFLAQVVVGVWAGRGGFLSSTPQTFASYGLSLPLVAATAVFGLVRPLSAGAVRALCGVPGERLAAGPAGSWAARGRTSAWWTLHLGVGALVSGISPRCRPWRWC